MFDYNCGYCRGALPDLAALMAEDPGLKVILKEFPSSSDGSVEAAKVAVLVNNDGRSTTGPSTRSCSRRAARSAPTRRSRPPKRWAATAWR